MGRRTKIVVAAAAFWAERGLTESGGVEELRHSQRYFGGVYGAEMICANGIVRGVPKQKNRAKKCGVERWRRRLGPGRGERRDRRRQNGVARCWRKSARIWEGEMRLEDCRRRGESSASRENRWRKNGAEAGPWLTSVEERVC